MIIDVQRAGPSTGMPTKPEQADLLMVLFGRNGESPVPVLAASTPGECFYAAIEAARVALTYRTPVLPALGRVPRERHRAVADPRHRRARSDPRRVRAGGRRASSCRTSATPRRWRGRGRFPGTPGLEHRIGGLEKQNETGNVAYDPENHDLMTQLRAQKVAGHRGSRPARRPSGGSGRARALVGRHVRAGARRRPPRPRDRRRRSRTRTSGG